MSRNGAADSAAAGAQAGMQTGRETLAGKVQTVLGLIEPESLGVVLPHEHLLCDNSSYFAEPAEAEKKEGAHEGVSLANLYWVRRSHFGNRDNLILDDKDLAVREALAFKEAGGNTIVELSNIGLGRDPEGLAHISRAAGVHVVMGCGYYIASATAATVGDKTVEQVAEEMIRDITVGVDGTGIRAGIIGEIGCSDPLEPSERRVLEAAALAQRKTGAAVNVHPSPFNDAMALEIADILRDAGADLGRVVISHCDQWDFSLDTCRSLADAGCYVEYDTLGFPVDIEFSFGKWRQLRSDAQRLNGLKQLIADGYEDHLLIAQDNCFKSRLEAYAGWGYGHILKNLLPPMRAMGFTEEHLNALLVENPRRLLTFASVDST